MHVVIGARDLVGQLACAVGRIVVGDQDVGIRNRLTGPADDACDVLRLVVGRDDHQNRSEGRGDRCLPFHFVLGCSAASVGSTGVSFSVSHGLLASLAQRGSRLWSTPTSSSLADGKRVPSLLLSAARGAIRCPLAAPRDRWFQARRRQGRPAPPQAPGPFPATAQLGWPASGRSARASRRPCSVL